MADIMKHIALFLLSSGFVIATPFRALSESRDLSLDSAGVTIRYTIDGEKGEPVVLIHGYGSSMAAWKDRGVINTLSKDYRVFALDVRGHGQSEKVYKPEQYGIEMANDVIRLLDKHEIGKAHIVGYSMGGFIVLKLLVQHPDRFITATLGGSGGIRENVWCDEWVREFPKRLDSRMSYAEALVDTWSLVIDTPLSDEVRDRLLAWDAPHDEKALAAAIRSWDKLRVTHTELKHNKVPTLVIYGSEESAGAIAFIEELESLMPQTMLHRIEGANHMNATGNPEFAGTLKQFLGQHRTH